MDTHPIPVGIGKIGFQFIMVTQMLEIQPNRRHRETVRDTDFPRRGAERDVLQFRETLHEPVMLFKDVPESVWDSQGESYGLKPTRWSGISFGCPFC